MLFLSNWPLGRLCLQPSSSLVLCRLQLLLFKAAVWLKGIAVINWQWNVVMFGEVEWQRWQLVKRVQTSAEMKVFGLMLCSFVTILFFCFQVAGRGETKSVANGEFFVFLPRDKPLTSVLKHVWWQIWHGCLCIKLQKSSRWSMRSQFGTIVFSIMRRLFDFQIEAGLKTKMIGIRHNRQLHILWTTVTLWSSHTVAERLLPLWKAKGEESVSIVLTSSHCPSSHNPIELF